MLARRRAASGKLAIILLAGLLVAPVGALADHRQHGQKDRSYKHATVGGGFENRATASTATVAGGAQNVAGGKGASVGGGAGNRASGEYSVVAGGWANSSRGEVAAVGGGENNDAPGDFSTIGGGTGNHAVGVGSTTAGGYGGRTSDRYATVGGGFLSTASGYASAVPGGYFNTAGGDYSVAMGRSATVRAQDHGTFVYADAAGLRFSSEGPNQFAVRASGGVRFYTSPTKTSGVTVAPGAGSWSTLSDRNAKTAFVSVDTKGLLDALMTLPISSWNWKAQDPSVRHIGPSAQDFRRAFRVGEDNQHISTVDADGVALASIQGVYGVVRQQEHRIDRLEARLSSEDRPNASPELWVLAAGMFVTGVGVGRRTRRPIATERIRTR